MPRALLFAHMRRMPAMRASRLLEQATVAVLPWVKKSDRSNILRQWRLAAAATVRYGLPADAGGVVDIQSAEDLRDWFLRAAGLRV